MDDITTAAAAAPQAPTRGITAAARLVQYAQHERMSTPASWSVLDLRLRTNGPKYGSIYLAWYWVLSVATVLSAPMSLLVWVAFVSVVGATLWSQRQPAALVLRGVTVEKRESFRVGVVTALCVAFFGGLLSMILWVLAIGTAFNLLHAGAMSLPVED
jgi:hypothetical protein